MNEDEEVTLGYYEPGFLHLRLNSDKPIDDLNVIVAKDPSLFSTFLHEYIHFLQNISTTTGLADSILWIDHIKHVNWEVRHNGGVEFEVPFELDDSSNVKVNKILRGIYRGGNEVVNQISYHSHSIEMVPAKDKDGRPLSVEKYWIHFTDISNYRTGKVHFGYRFLKEYVAHAIQSEFYSQANHPDIPYLACELIIQKECPTLATDQKLMIALCDACLMTFHPAQIFFKTLVRLKNSKTIPTTPDEVYEFVYRDVTLQGVGVEETVDSLFNKLNSEAITQFDDAFKAELLRPTFKWLQYVLLEGKRLRDERRSFMCELVSNEGVLSNLFGQISIHLGTPFFSDQNFNGKFIPPQALVNEKIDPHMGITLKALLNVFHGHRQCSLHQFCQTNPGEVIVNEHCTKSPWLRATDAQLCPFAVLWKTWGLVGKVPTPAKKSQ